MNEKVKVLRKKLIGKNEVLYGKVIDVLRFEKHDLDSEYTLIDTHILLENGKKIIITDKENDPFLRRYEILEYV